MKVQNPYQLTLLCLLILFVLPTNAQVVICGDNTNPNYISFEDTIIVSGTTYDVKFDLTGDFEPDLYFDVDVNSPGGYSSTITVIFQVFVSNPNFEMMMDEAANPDINPYYVHGFAEGDTVNYDSENFSWEQDTNGELVNIYNGSGGVGGGGAWAYDSLLYLGFRYIGICDTTYGWFKLNSDIVHNDLSIVSASVLDINDFNIIPWSFEKDNGIFFLPNPAINQIMPVVGFSGKWLIYSYNGSLIYSAWYQNNELIYFPEGMQRGLYIIQFLGEENQSVSSPLIIN